MVVGLLSGVLLLSSINIKIIQADRHGNTSKVTSHGYRYYSLHNIHFQAVQLLLIIGAFKQFSLRIKNIHFNLDGHGENEEIQSLGFAKVR